MLQDNRFDLHTAARYNDASVLVARAIRRLVKETEPTLTIAIGPIDAFSSANDSYLFSTANSQQGRAADIDVCTSHCGPLSQAALASEWLSLYTSQEQEMWF